MQTLRDLPMIVHLAVVSGLLFGGPPLLRWAGRRFGRPLSRRRTVMLAAAAVVAYALAVGR